MSLQLLDDSTMHLFMEHSRQMGSAIKMDRVYKPEDLDQFRLRISNLSVGDPFRYYPEAQGIDSTSPTDANAKPPAKPSLGDLILNRFILTNSEETFQPFTGISQVNNDTFDLHGDNYHVMTAARRQLPTYLASWLGSEYSNLAIAQEVHGLDTSPLTKGVQPLQLDGKFQAQEVKFELDSQDSINKGEIEALNREKLLRDKADQVNKLASEIATASSGGSSTSASVDSLASETAAIAAPIRPRVVTRKIAAKTGQNPKTPELEPERQLHQSRRKAKAKPVKPPDDNKEPPTSFLKTVQKRIDSKPLSQQSNNPHTTPTSMPLTSESTSDGDQQSVSTSPSSQVASSSDDPPITQE